MIEDTTKFRVPRALERRVFELLLDDAFAGRDEIREQISTCLVQTIDEDSSLQIKVSSGPSTRAGRRIPTEAEFTDADGIVCHLLHVVDGLASELESYKDDGSRVINPLDPSLIRLADYYGSNERPKPS